ncbi:MAG: F0F1 ATP synthase subunit A [Candidatus Competibacteraceae bacterium]
MGKQELLGWFSFHLGPLTIGPTLLTSWLLTILLGVLSWWATRRLRVVDPTPLQVTLEGIVATIDEAIRSVLPQQSAIVLPFIATLWLFIGAANLIGVLPGLRAPTGDLAVTAALAVLVFLSVHWFGIRSVGLGDYLRHYLRPNPLLLPFHLLSEITRTLALALRLFGNIMSLELAALLVLLVAGALAPVPLLLLHIIEALVQAYIFGMLALIYVAGAMQSHQLRKQA